LALAVGKAIRILRKRAGISQENLALEAGVARGYMGRLERGEGSPSISTIYKLLPHLKVRFSEFALEVEQQLQEFHAKVPLRLELSRKAKKIILDSGGKACP